MGTIPVVKLATFLELGRTSNLPTVWSNVVCGAVLSGAAFSAATMGVLVIAGSALYVGGMLLNDAFDADVDARERPERPIPSGRVSRREVFAIGLVLLAIGILSIAAASVLGVIAHGVGPTLAAIATAAAVVVYNRWHKGRPWSPVVMGLCRAGLYAMAALSASGALTRPVLLAAAALLLYVIGLTHVARFENASTVARIWPALFVLAPLLLLAPEVRTLRVALCAALLWVWIVYGLSLARRGGRNIPRAVVSLIAGISLVDAALMAPRGAVAPVLAVAAFLLTLALQRRIRGT
jgi:heme O synthase-like polyprenyltransferase